jgi:hypothetical protein
MIKSSIVIVLTVTVLMTIITVGGNTLYLSQQIQSAHSSPASEEEPSNDEAQQDEPTDGGDEPTLDEPVHEPVPSPSDEIAPVPLDEVGGGGVTEKEKECHKREYDNNGRCTTIPNCVFPETWSPTLQVCRVFPWWETLR